jgi:hypothetical protein
MDLAAVAEREYMHYNNNSQLCDAWLAVESGAFSASTLQNLGRDGPLSTTSVLLTVDRMKSA